MKLHGLTRRTMLQGIAAIGVIAAAGRSAHAAEKWDFTIYYGPGHPLTKLYEELAADIGKRSNGELDITVRTAGELPFKATEAVPVVGNGQVEMALGYMGFIAGTTKIAALPGLPFLIRDADEAEKAMAILLPYVDKAVQANGARILLWNGQHWPQNLYGRGEPVTRLEDLKGRNARGSSPEQGDIIRRRMALTQMPLSFLSQYRHGNRQPTCSTLDAAMGARHLPAFPRRPHPNVFAAFTRYRTRSKTTGSERANPCIER